VVRRGRQLKSKCQRGQRAKKGGPDEKNASLNQKKKEQWAQIPLGEGKIFRGDTGKLPNNKNPIKEASVEMLWLGLCVCKKGKNKNSRKIEPGKKNCWTLGETAISKVQKKGRKEV